MAANSEPALASDEKRRVDRAILKNRGLAPRRDKGQRNPRVKQRSRYARAQKRLGSMRQVAQTPQSAYGGEATGIKSRLTKSVKLG